MCWPPRLGSSMRSALPTTSSSVSHSLCRLKAAGLDPRHIQQVVHQTGGVEHMLANFIGLRSML